MTIRLLSQYQDYPTNTVVTLPPDREAYLVNIGAASTTLTGGIPYVPPVVPNQVVPAQLSVRPDGTIEGFVGPGGKIVTSIEQPAPGNLITKYGKTAADLSLSNLSSYNTAVTHSVSSDYSRFSTFTRKCNITANTAQLAFTGLSFSCDPDDKLFSIDVYLPDHPNEFLGAGATPGINIRIANASNGSGTNEQWTFDSTYLRQGWNTLKMWQGDTFSATPGAGNLPHGVAHLGGTPLDWLSTARFIEINFYNMNGKAVYLDQFRRGTKATPILVMGFDAAGAGLADDVFVKSVAPLFARYGYRGYVTVTSVDATFSGSTDWNRRITLQNAFGWDVVNHTWSHGGTAWGGAKVVTLARTANVVTATTGVAHGFTVGSTIKANIAGASPVDMNGVFTMSVTSTTALTYTAAGADGAATGTINLRTFMSEVLNVDTAEMRALTLHEVKDTSDLLKATGFAPASHILVYPNNSVPHLGPLSYACEKAGVKYGRGYRGGYTYVNEFGVDNPLNFGSFEMGSSTPGNTSLTYMKTKLAAAIARGDHMWTYGHFILDETDPVNTAHANADLEYPPGNNGNPNPPSASVGGGVGGWWYLGTLRRFFDEAVAPAVAGGQLKVMSPSQWAAYLGNAR